MEVLVCLASSPGEVIPKSRFFREVWPDTFVGDEALTHAISELRKAFGDNPKASAFIETIPKSGYRLIAPVHREPSDAERLEPVASRSYRRLTVSIALLMLMAVSGGWLWTRHRTGSPPPRTLPLTADAGTEEYPALSPDASEVAFIAQSNPDDPDDEAAVFVKSISGSDRNSVRRVMSAPGSAPVWSPDGHTIAIYRKTPGESGIYLVPADGSNPIGERVLPVTWGHANLARVSWSEDTLAFSERDSPGQPYHISLLSLHGRTIRRITSPPESGSMVGDGWPFGDFWPAFSPDGTMLAFIRSEKYLQEHLYVTALDGSPPRLLASDQSRIMGVTWTADGREIIYSSNRSGGFRMALWRIPSTGGDPRPIPEADPPALDPSVSRAGGRLVFTHYDGEPDIWRLPLGAGNVAPPVRLIAWSSSEYAAAYSPDGARIAFDSARTGAQEIWVCNADGSSPVQLTFRGVSPTGSPRWSPDGRMIAFHSRDRDHDQIWVIPSRGGEPRRLTGDPSHNDSPIWSLDGRFVYFRSRRDDAVRIWKVAAEGGPPAAITAEAGRPATESHDGRFLYFIVDDPPGIWRAHITGGSEARVYDLPGADASRKWAATAKGIYVAGADEVRRPAVFFFDFDAQRPVPIGLLPTGRIVGIAAGALGISPDGRWLLAPMVGDVRADLRLVEGFR